MPEKQSFDRADLSGLLDDVYLGTVAFTTESGPDAVPVAVAEHGDTVVWHGSTGSGWMRRITQGILVAVSVTCIDALVVGRAQFENSFWYRSAVIRGIPQTLLGRDREAALAALTERIIPGRTGETRSSSGKELAATMVLSLRLDDWTLKVSRRWPTDSDQDRATDVWAGVLPLVSAYGPVRPAPDLASDVPLPESCARLIGAVRCS